MPHQPMREISTVLPDCGHQPFTSHCPVSAVSSIATISTSRVSVLVLFWMNRTSTPLSDQPYPRSNRLWSSCAVVASISAEEEGISPQLAIASREWCLPHRTPDVLLPRSCPVQSPKLCASRQTQCLRTPTPAPALDPLVPHAELPPRWDRSD